MTYLPLHASVGESDLLYRCYLDYAFSLVHASNKKPSVLTLIADQASSAH